MIKFFRKLRVRYLERIIAKTQARLRVYERFSYSYVSEHAKIAGDLAKYETSLKQVLADDIKNIKPNNDIKL